MPQNYSFKEVEESILKFWKDKGIYQKAKSKNKNGKDWYFLDGPPYTSGKMHIGLAWNKSLKDSVLRYKRMRGFNAYDRAGYDMHGLPTEHRVVEKFKIKHKNDIPKFGIARFVKECKKLAVENMEAMNKDFIRLGVWMDFENAYKSITNEFIEGEWWLIKKAHENKRLYQGKRVMHWCRKCATVLAKHELEYQKDTDDSIFLKFKVKNREREYLIIWTTTPWTIPFNLAVMVNPELDYVRAGVKGEVWIIAKGLVGSLIAGVANEKFEIIEEFTGEKLEGLQYEHPLKDEIGYDSMIESPKLHAVVLSTEYVGLSAGSGLVHCAPGCGPEDYEIGYRNGLPPFNNLDEEGVFPKEMGKYAGWVAKKDDKKFIEELKKNGSLIASTKVEHEYAHCWRCHEAVIFRATTQWFFKVEDLKDRMRQLNKKVMWEPEWAGSRWFDSWLDNLRDNAITRQRYWGTPLPVWQCEKCHDYIVIGSIKELKELAKDERENAAKEKDAKGFPEELHKPSIDRITMKCRCGSVKTRVPDILDVWIDAGTTSWTALDYPQKAELFKKLYPADFILEGKDQIRGWFNLLLVASMVAMQKHSYKAVYMHGFTNDALGRKMSKSLGNIISPYEVIDKYGADALRYYMIGGANAGVDINYNFDDIRVKYRNLTVLWNLHNFVIDYAKTTGANPTKVSAELSLEEKFILSKLNTTIRRATGLFEGYKIDKVPWAVEELFLELSRTYLQLTREKSSLGSRVEKETVLYTIYNVLIETLKLLAPIAPFITEKIYQNLKVEFNLKEESIHLFDWPSADKGLVDEGLEASFEVAKQLIQAVLSGREKLQLGVRWPLKELVIVTADKDVMGAVRSLKDIIKTHTNVKNIRLQEALEGVKLVVKADYKKLGPDFGKNAPKIIARLSEISPEKIVNRLNKEGKIELSIDGKNVEIVKEHLVIQRVVPLAYIEEEFKNGIVYLNKERTDELESEGYARELMRRVQALRKENGLKKTDSIMLFIKCENELNEFLNRWKQQIREKVGAEKIEISEISPARKHKVHSKENIKGADFEVFFSRI